MAGPETGSSEASEAAGADIPLAERITRGIREHGGVTLGMRAEDFRRQTLTDADGNPIERRSTFGE